MSRPSAISMKLRHFFHTLTWTVRPSPGSNSRVVRSRVHPTMAPLGRPSCPWSSRPRAPRQSPNGSSVWKSNTRQPANLKRKGTSQNLPRTTQRSQTRSVPTSPKRQVLRGKQENVHSTESFLFTNHTNQSVLTAVLVSCSPWHKFPVWRAKKWNQKWLLKHIQKQSLDCRLFHIKVKVWFLQSKRNVHLYTNLGKNHLLYQIHMITAPKTAEYHRKVKNAKLIWKRGHKSSHRSKPNL